MTRHVLAIDLGTSALKVALVSVAGEVVAAEQETHDVTLLPGGGAEQDPRRWWDLITKASAKLMARGHVPAASVAAVACTAQWSGTVAVDDGGQPLRDAIIWMDSRGAPYVRQISPSSSSTPEPTTMFSILQPWRAASAVRRSIDSGSP